MKFRFRNKPLRVTDRSPVRREKGALPRLYPSISGSKESLRMNTFFIHYYYGENKKGACRETRLLSIKPAKY